jgi:glycosyltransferase involved in cell wall biosynthesis
MMATRELLIISLHFPPCGASGSFRMLGFVRHLPRFDWQVVVVAPPMVPSEPIDRGLQDHVPSETVLYPVPYPEDILAKCLRKAGLGLHSAWLLKALSACSRAVRAHRPDAVLTTGPPHVTHLLGLFLKRRFGVTWVADFRDPWMTKDEATPTCGSAGQPGSLRWRWLAFLERSVIAHADLIASTAPLATQKLQETFPTHQSKFITLTNGYDPERFGGRDTRASSGDCLRIVHTGEIYAGRDPRPFLDAVRELESERGQGRKPTSVCFFGKYSGYDFDLAEEIRRRNLGEVVDCCGQVSYDRVLREMCRSDILLLLDTPGRRVGVPAKLYEYIGAGRPVLALTEQDGDVAWVIRESGIPARIVSPLDAAGIKQALIELSQELTEGLSTPAAGQQHPPFSRESITGRLVALLEDGPGRPKAAGPDGEEVAVGVPEVFAGEGPLSVSSGRV